MRRPRHLSRLELCWVENVIRQLCARNNISDRDDDYRSAALTAFFTAFRRFRPITSPRFWPYACKQINAALLMEKKARSERLYRLLSLDAPAGHDSVGTYLDLLPARQGDFTNGVCFRDFLNRLPRDPARLAFRLVWRDSLEEARSNLGMTEQEFCVAFDQLHSALERYYAI